MRKGDYTFVRMHRRRWGLTQPELATLLGFECATSVSKLERSERNPSVEILLACVVVFELSVPELFPSLYGEIEEAALRGAKHLHDQLRDRTDRPSEIKRRFLEEMLARIIGRNQSEQV